MRSREKPPSCRRSRSRGGVSDNGAIGRVRVARIVADQKREFRVKLTDMVEAGDTLIVPERFF
jgi:hypothetical protein